MTLDSLITRLRAGISTFRTAERVGHLSSAVAVILTVAMVGSAQATEANPYSAWIIAHGGFLTWAAMSPFLVAAFFALARLTSRGFTIPVLGREVDGSRATSLFFVWLFVAALAVDALGNVIGMALTGFPNVYFAWFSPIAATVSTLALALALRWELAWLARSVSRRVASVRGSKVAAALACLLVITSGLGGIVFTQDYSAVQNASAATMLEDFEADASGWSGGNLTTTNVIEGSQSYNISDDASFGGPDQSGSYNSYQFKINPNGFDTSAPRTRISIEDGSTNSVTSVGFNNTGYVMYHDGGANYVNTSIALTAGSTYTYRLVPDFTNDQYDLRIYDASGNKIGEVLNIAFQSAVSQIGHMTGGYAGAGGFVLDKIEANADAPKPTYSVSGTVKDADGNAISGATVSDGSGNSTTTSADGSWSMDLVNDTYTLTASKSGYVNKSKSVTVSGSPETLNFTLAKRGVFGQVVSCPVTNPACSDPGGVPDGTVVEAYGVNESNINPDQAQTLEERAAEIRDDMRTVEDSMGWNASRQLVGDAGEWSTSPKKYVALHRKDQWGLTAWGDDPKLETPLLSPPADEPFIMSVWDPTTGDSFNEDGVERDLPGTPTGGTIVVEQLDYNGDVLKTYEFKTNQEYKVYAGVGFAKVVAGRHKYAEVSLPAGFYRVSAKDSSYSYVMAVGSPQEQLTAITSDLQNKSNQLSSQADEVRDLMNQNKVTELTTTTYTKNGEQGHFNFSSVPKGVHVVAVQAYTPSAPSHVLNDPQNASIQDLREVAALDSYNGSFYVSQYPKDVKVPTYNAEIRTVEVSAAPFMDAKRFGNRTAWLKDLLQNDSYADTVKNYLGLSDRNTSQILSRLDELKNQNQQLQERYNDLERRYQNQTGDSNPSNSTELRLLRQAVRDLQGSLKTQDTTTTYSDGTISATIPWNGDLDADTVSVTAHYPGVGVQPGGSGASEPVPDEYVSVNKRPGRGDEVKVMDYPVSYNTSMVTFSVTVSGEDGEGIGNTKVPVENPGFSGRMLSLESVSVSTLRPGPNEQVSIRANPEDESARIQSVNATVEGPNGQANTTHGATNDVVQFTTNGAGSYYVTLDITDTAGNSWTEGLAVEAGSESVTNPPSVRARDGFLGMFAMVGDGLATGTMTTSGGTVEGTAVAPADNVPGSVHFYTSEVSNNYKTTSVRVLKQSGSGEPESIRKHVKVFVHTAKISENAVIYRQGSQPLEVGEETAFGKVTCEGVEGGCTIRTYTNGQGAVDVTVNNNPTVVDSTLHWVRMQVPFNPSLFVGFPTPDAGSVTDGPLVQFQIPMVDLASAADLGEMTPGALAAASGGVTA